MYYYNYTYARVAIVIFMIATITLYSGLVIAMFRNVTL